MGSFPDRNMNSHIRLAHEKDIETLVQFRLSLLEELGKPIEESLRKRTEQTLRHYFVTELATGTCIAWVAESSGSIVATGAVNVFHRIPYPKNLSGKERYLLNMFTIPSFRGKGIGAEIVKTIRKYAVDNGYKRILLNASPQGRSVYLKGWFQGERNRHGFVS